MSRILQLVTRDEPGGVQVLTQTVEALLRQRGHAVETLALARPRHALWRTARTILRGRYDAILSYQVAAGLAGGLLGRCSGVPTRAVHLTALPSAMRPAWRALDRAFGAMGLHTAIVANSAATAASVAHYPSAYRRRITLIPHGVPPMPVGQGVDWRSNLAIAPDTKLLVASGRLVEQKDQCTAVAALPLLPGMHLALAGEGHLRDALLAQTQALGVADRLHLLGNLDRPVLADLLAGADLCLFPSVWESFGLAAVEAAMLGVPIIASDLAVLREVLAVPVDYGMARFHPAGDAVALATRVHEAFALMPDRDARARCAVASAAAHSLERMTERYCGLVAARPSAAVSSVPRTDRGATPGWPPAPQ